jgi:hypothetical protein
MYSLSDQSKFHMVGIDPRLIEIAEIAITTSARDFGIPPNGGLHPPPVHDMYCSTHNPCACVLRRDLHQEGKALDFYALCKGKRSLVEEDLMYVAIAMLQAAHKLGYRLIWGGLWENGRVWNHVQIEDV